MGLGSVQYFRENRREHASWHNERAMQQHSLLTALLSMHNRTRRHVLDLDLRERRWRQENMWCKENIVPALVCLFQNVG